MIYCKHCNKVLHTKFDYLDHRKSCPERAKAIGGNEGLHAVVEAAAAEVYGVTIRIRIGERTSVSLSVVVADHCGLINIERLEERLEGLFAHVWDIHSATGKEVFSVMPAALARPMALAIQRSMNSPNGMQKGDRIFEVSYRNIMELPETFPSMHHRNN